MMVGDYSSREYKWGELRTWSESSIRHYGVFGDELRPSFYFLAEFT